MTTTEVHVSLSYQLLERYWQNLLNRLNAHLDQAGLLKESQCGFRKDTGTIDMIFTARRLQEKCQEQNVDLYMTFVDLTKAFDTVSPDGLWKIMAKLPARLAICSPCILSICNIYLFPALVLRAGFDF